MWLQCQWIGQSVWRYGGTKFCITFCKPGCNTIEYDITADGICTSTQTDSITTGLTAGTHVVSVTDANGCTATDSVTITEPPPLAAFIDSVANIDCFGNCNGFARADATGGTPPYTYIWNTMPVTIGDTLSGLCVPGTYCVTITDSNGCSDSACVIITEPAPLQIIPTVTDVSCFGDCDGAISLNVTGGTAPYDYLLDTGDTTVPFTGLCAGTYCVAVIDVNGCIADTCVTITELPQLSLVIDSITPSTCGLQNGAACVTVIGGVVPYTIQWNNPMFPSVPYNS